MNELVDRNEEIQKNMAGKKTYPYLSSKLQNNAVRYRDDCTWKGTKCKRMRMKYGSERGHKADVPKHNIKLNERVDLEKTKLTNRLPIT